MPAARLGNARDGETGYGTRCVRTAIKFGAMARSDPWQQPIVFAKPARVQLLVQSWFESILAFVFFSFF